MRIFLLISVIFIALNTQAQNYTRDAGVRLGDYFTVMGRIHTEDDQALEGMLFIGRNSVSVAVMKEHFEPAFGHISENLYLEYGYGVHFGIRYTDHYKVLNRTYGLDDYRTTPLLGLDGLVGLEYRFNEFPFLISLDIKPYFEYSTIQIFSIYLQSVGFSIKYRF
jgi:hypothetical protein